MIPRISRRIFVCLALLGGGCVRDKSEASEATTPLAGDAPAYGAVRYGDFHYGTPCDSSC